MRTLILILFLLIPGAAVKGQNLVPNGSFEDYTRLPCYINFYYIQDLLTGWVQPIPTTSDYWHTGISRECFLNPENINAKPRTGKGMAGIITADLPTGNRTEYKEYIEIRLSRPLRKGWLYELEYFARNFRIIPRIDQVRSNNLGAAFTRSLILHYAGDNTPDHLLMKTELKHPEVVDGEWNKIGGCFVADSSYQYLLIGNFDPVGDTELERMSYDNVSANAYYFIDDVKLLPLPYNLSHLQEQVTFCHDREFVTLDAAVQGASAYRWEDGSTMSSLVVSPRISRDYAVRISFNECVYTHIFRVQYVPPLNLGPDTLLCGGETLTLHPAHPVREFLWSDASTDTVRQITAPGTYGLKILTEDCVVEDTMQVDFVDCPGFTPNILTLNNDNLNDQLIFPNIDTRTWSLEVFNRWGKRVFSSEHYRNDWDGRDLPDGVYYYRLYSADLDKVVKGWVQTVR